MAFTILSSNLYDAATGGKRMGGALALDNVTVNDDISSVELPFGTFPLPATRCGLISAFATELVAAVTRARPRVRSRPHRQGPWRT